jgi:hypothetical protein
LDGSPIATHAHFIFHKKKTLGTRDGSSAQKIWCPQTWDGTFLCNEFCQFVSRKKRKKREIRDSIFFKDWNTIGCIQLFLGCNTQKIITQ